MRIEKGCVVTIEYTLKDQEGNVWETSQGDEPWIYLHGFGGIIPGLEPELTQKAAGDKLEVTLSADLAYGDYEADLANKVPREAFADIEDLAVGLRLSAQTEDGSTHTVTVTEVTDETVTVDANHPMAGKPVTVAVSVLAVRPATPDELEHGHPHVDGQCH
ncbi:FKBP-type peptidyl-prolyl cis-trans isomerase [Pleionea litopenaei]|uniref:Peptidyl-prolyl cis-trans isomerase n=1 Tax=Pleionea litopenaei TaxID=3070815 RepID=A0AA51RQH7_9GAMM|nr:FKBP-type peptidyl-prolyl cis-trans isomerase [Pleionea sp. HL-JVS1]WMS85746.1 FKBP-type peptidyl-prolyl cis-trans isomerase [Pleionea sp. HL-JVS1]